MRRVARVLAEGAGGDGDRPTDAVVDAQTDDDGGSSGGGGRGGGGAAVVPAAATTPAAGVSEQAVAVLAAKKDARKEHIANQRRKRAFYASQFMQPEWLNCQPSFRSPDWMIVARPDGQRCIVSASRGLTTSRTKNGNVLHRWPSELPMGSRQTSGGRNDEYSLLDCVFHKPTRTYFVLDVMCWKGRLLYDTEASFRMWWLRTKLAEECPGVGSMRAANRFAIVPVTVFPCTPEGLAAAARYPNNHLSGAAASAAAEEGVPYTRDGVLFYHKQGFYEQGTTPLVRQWKDEVCSRYVVNTTGDGVGLGLGEVDVDSQHDQQRVVLHVAPTGALVTVEGQKLGQLTRAHVQQLNVQPGDFLRFRVGGVHWDAATGALRALEAPQFEKACGPSRVQADAASAIVFQHRARTVPLDVRTVAAGIILDSAAATPPPPPLPGTGSSPSAAPAAAAAAASAAAAAAAAAAAMAAAAGPAFGVGGGGEEGFFHAGVIPAGAAPSSAVSTAGFVFGASAAGAGSPFGGGATL